jgi:hypothetical protein
VLVCAKFSIRILDISHLLCIMLKS